IWLRGVKRPRTGLRVKETDVSFGGVSTKVLLTLQTGPVKLPAGWVVPAVTVGGGLLNGRDRDKCAEPVPTAGLELLDITALRVKVPRGRRASEAPCHAYSERYWP